MDGYQEIRSLSQSHVQTLVRWAAEEGWNPGPFDAEAFWATDPEGFLGVTDGNELIAGGSIVRHNPSFGFMGLFIVAPQYRGQKIGTALWTRRRDTLLSRLEAGGVIGLDAVTSMIPFYHRGGFEVAYRQRRFQWSPHAIEVRGVGEVINAGEYPLEAIKKFDKGCFPGPRDSYLNAWLSIPNITTVIVRDATGLKGYCVLRPCLNGSKIGPLHADSMATAEDLLDRLAATDAPRPFYIDMPDENPLAQSLAESRGLEHVFECTRMYYGKAPSLDLSKVFGITSFELG